MDELALVSLPHLHKKLAQLQAQHPHQSSPRSFCTMWNHKHAQDDQEENDGDSWEVRAFAEDTGSAMGTTWPPRSYTCTFCRRDFRSAQALGGHMNVHRRDRARLHQVRHANSTSINPSSNGGLCLLYQLQGYPNHNGSFTTSSTTPTSIASNFISNINVESSSLVPSSVLSITANPLRDYLMASPENILKGPNGVSSYVNNSHCHVDAKRLADEEDQPSSYGFADVEEVDLELRLGPS